MTQTFTRLALFPTWMQSQSITEGVSSLNQTVFPLILGWDVLWGISL
jgi:hypothetical protein